VEVISATLLVTVLGFLGRRAMKKAIQEQEEEQRQNLLTINNSELEEEVNYDIPPEYKDVTNQYHDMPPDYQTEPTLIVVERPE